MVYLGSMINFTFEIFIVFNLVYLAIFLPKELEGVLGMLREGSNALLDKIKYKK